MEKNRSTKIIAFIALFVAVIGLSVGYAGYSTILQIKGSANVKAQSWNIHFENLEKTSNMTAKELTVPQIQPSTTLISGVKVEFNEPGQVGEYKFDIVNAGTFDSIVTGVTIKTPTCTGNGDNATLDASNVCKNISVKVTDADGVDITNGRTLKSGEKLEGCKLTITYNASVPVAELPVNDVEVADIDATVVFSQN